ncbi:MAG: hypothetical protein KF721_03545 [Ignavibacteriaceae bacterium]|nr:hypothetical protein [Ignavibacteriaceae bacterium]
MSQAEPQNILLIDDDLTIRKLIGFHLRKKDYYTLEASDNEGFALEQQKLTWFYVMSEWMEWMDLLSVKKLEKMKNIVCFHSYL